MLRQPADMEDCEDVLEDRDSVPLLRRPEKVKKWDIFLEEDLEEADEDESRETKFFEIAEKVLKIACYFVSFGFILASSLVSKGCLLFMTSVISNNSMNLCSDKSFHLGNDMFYKVEVKPVEKVAWIWCIFFAIITPEFLTFFRSLRFCLFKSFKKPTAGAFLWVFITETLYAVGVVLLTFGVLPKLDVVKGAMITNCVCLVPAVFLFLSRPWSGCCFKKECFKYGFDILAILAQASGVLVFVFWNKVPLEFLLALLLVSFSFWENYVDDKCSLACMKKLHALKEEIKSSRYYVYLLLSVWKVIVMFVVLTVFLWAREGEIYKHLFNISASLEKRNISAVWRPPGNFERVPRTRPEQQLTEKTDALAPVYVALIQIAASFMCYIFGTFACRIRIQCFSFSFPLSLTVPLAMSLLISACRFRQSDNCVFKAVSYYLFWTCPEQNFFQTFLTEEHGWIWVLWLISQAWITVHVWTPKKDRISKVDKLFVNPYYCGVLLDQSLMLNRRREDELQINYEELKEDVSRLARPSIFLQEEQEDHKSDHVTRIYACATMWHEEEGEMIQMLKSIFKMDEDQSARHLAQTYLQVVDADFYLFEAHILFDDAFVKPTKESSEKEVNEYVQCLLTVIEKAAKKVHGPDCILAPPKKFSTPYGGRLVWTLPGQNNLIVHLKDKDKIRHKKRWSQVMYMYYLLGHKLMELNLSKMSKSIRAMNTYILALDGDIDFEPHAVQLLVDRMKRSRVLGAACGRIHPIGSGPMVYYQKFEYAIGHWFQKATEHMIGCVLCSPGCFSLFRAKALMENNVMKKYTTESKDPVHFIQYDQGEDRWLCTLLLQQGYRVEYCAASDAYTHCPENFKDFYIQRRRWAPSTMANIVDLLKQYKQTTAINDNISTLYIAYQLMLMIGTILGPGTILLMLNGAMVAAFRLSNLDSLMANLLPVSIFIIACFFLKNDTQIVIAEVLTACYALLMMAVLVGTAVQLVEDGIGSPAAIFLIATACSFVLAAILHPKEFFCVVHGVIYFLSVPSMYLLLVLYAFINMHVVSWGTREATVVNVETPKQDAPISNQMSFKNKVDKSWKWLIGGQYGNEEGSISCGIANLFRCLCCTYPKPNDKKMQLLHIQEQLAELSRQIGGLEEQICRKEQSGVSHTPQLEVLPALKEESEVENEIKEDNKEVPASLQAGHAAPKEIPPTQQDINQPFWMENKILKKCEKSELHERETRFWNGLIKKYLYPLDSDAGKKEETEIKLKSLRNNMVFGFLMANSLFILIIFLLQVNKDMLFIQWPLSAKYNITYIPASNNIVIIPTYQSIEPVGIVFAFFFALVLFIQFFAMLFHRLQTLSHIMASTDLNLCSNNMDVSGEAFIIKNSVKLAKGLQKMKVKKEVEKKVMGPDRIARRPTIHMLESRAEEQSNVNNLQEVFVQRFWNSDFESNDIALLKSTRKKSVFHQEVMSALHSRRSTIKIEPFQSADSSGMTDTEDYRRLNECFGAKYNDGFENSDDNYERESFNRSPRARNEASRM